MRNDIGAVSPVAQAKVGDGMSDNVGIQRTGTTPDSVDGSKYRSEPPWGRNGPEGAQETTTSPPLWIEALTKYDHSGITSKLLQIWRSLKERFATSADTPDAQAKPLALSTEARTKVSGGIQLHTGLGITSKMLQDLRSLRKDWPEARNSSAHWLSLPPNQMKKIEMADAVWEEIGDIYTSFQVARRPTLAEDIKTVQYALKIIRTQLDNRGVTKETWYNNNLLAS